MSQNKLFLRAYDCSRSSALNKPKLALLSTAHRLGLKFPNCRYTVINYSFLSGLENDSIFLIVSSVPIFYIYEKIEKNGIIKWNYFGDYGQEYLIINLPPIIYPIDDEKFIFFSQKTLKPMYDRGWQMSINPIELWEMNNNWSRSSLKFPTDLRHKIETNSTRHLWIVQI